MQMALQGKNAQMCPMVELYKLEKGLYESWKYSHVVFTILWLGQS